MQKLQKLIEDKLNIPIIDENESVYDGCFMIYPYMTSGIQGNGIPQNLVTSVSLELFYSDKLELLSISNNLWLYLHQNGYISSSPDYIYEKNASLWRCSIKIEILN